MTLSVFFTDTSNETYLESQFKFSAVKSIGKVHIKMLVDILTSCITSRGFVLIASKPLYS